MAELHVVAEADGVDTHTSHQDLDTAAPGAEADTAMVAEAPVGGEMHVVDAVAAVAKSETQTQKVHNLVHLAS